MAPVTSGSSDVLDPLSYHLQPKLDLQNFEDPRHEDGKYVLTSPRSLEACSRLKIKPVELLYKPLSEFQEELLPCDVALRSIFNIYDDHEQNRQRKLRRCREERRRIIADDLNRETTSVSIYREPAYTHHGLEGDSSVQRERTKWVSSIGHDRVSRQELNIRAKQLYNDSYRPRTVGSKTISYTKRKKLRSKKGENSVNSQSANSSRNSLKSHSLTRSCGNRDNSQPITNPKLRRQLSNSSLASATTIPKRDQKILELMMSKGEEERKHYAERNAASLSWDEDRKRQIAIQNEAERKRRQMLSRERSEWESHREKLAAERSRLDETTRETRERSLDSKLSRSQLMLDQTLRSKALQLEDKKREEYLRKKAQENNREALTQEELEMRDLVNEKQRRDISEAVRRREARLSMSSLRKSLENSEREAQYRRRMAHLQASDSMGKENLRASLDAKHAHAAEKYEQVLSRRDLQLSLNQREREKKQRQAELSHKLQEHQMDEWRQSLCSYRQSLAERASESLNRTIQQKAERTARDRREKQQLQRANIRRVAEELESWRRSTELHLVEKDRRVDEIQTEREANIQQTRATAHATEVMREELRQKYAADSFDKKVLKAEIFNKIGRGLLGKTQQGQKNRSKVKLAYV